MRLSMTKCEPGLDELLGDEMMSAVARSAGNDPAGLRALMRDVAGRLPEQSRIRPRCGSPVSRGCQPSAA